MRFLIAGIALLLLGAAAQAQPDHEKNAVSLRLGNSVVVIPTPEGYAEITAQYESLKAHFAATEPPQNELLAGYLLINDLGSLKSGKATELEQWAKIAVVRETKERNITVEEFSRIVDVIRGQDKKLLDMESPAIKSLFREFDKYLSKEFSKDIKTAAGETTILGSFTDRPNAYSMMFLSTLQREVDGKTTMHPILATLNAVHVKDRIISVATYRGYRSEADVATLKTFTTNWVNSIVEANK